MDSFSVRYLEPGESVTYVSQQRFSSFAPDLRIYCYRGQNHSIATIFQSARFQLSIDNEDFVQYEGDTPEMVKTHYDNQRSIFSFNVMNTSKRKIIKINPFNQTCMGIESVHKYTLHLNVLRLDFGKLILLGVGLLLFIYAEKFSQTPLFYYLSGIFLGIFASFLVLVYFSSKLFPRVRRALLDFGFELFELLWILIYPIQRPMMYGVMIGGWTLGLYFLQMLWEHLNVILIAYQAYVFWYVVATGSISFVICYRMGPPKNQRSKDLIKWGLQLIASIMIFYSSNYREASVSIMIAVVFWQYFPISTTCWFRSFWWVCGLFWWVIEKSYHFSKFLAGLNDFHQNQNYSHPKNFTNKACLRPQKHWRSSRVFAAVRRVNHGKWWRD